ncbi:hypothetical protein E2562_001197 [Oryza meyeriana var. granulata]|uniref:Uncharacterized protein n=1 Tax=Oryza meyeriana var. granulata TaxID=110450 RepID=A0A6G1DC13_9ORYZ|nr:hypothetical protein E2562_001197 [Oryza meyeriana var. granulata]
MRGMAASSPQTRPATRSTDRFWSIPNGKNVTSSLRYYGIRLRNGNYTVTLQLAEMLNELDGSFCKEFGVLA